MTLTAGTQLGPYEILAPIGAGGMGEVYKAKDTRLDRTVAIKVLPEHLADDDDLRQRFEQEARAVSSLNHPNICTLHDIGHEDGVDFIVMEYIEGKTLADRLNKGALPLDQALEYGIQIADALDKAHRRGVVHRDLKPGNIMLTKSGAKLLDFGLAKLHTTQPSGEPDLSALATEAKPLTKKGSIIGTFQYMAPEQLEGKDVDARTDIFAFGVVLYEMVTGKKAFEGQSQASLIVAILERNPPPISTIQAMTPPELDQIVKTCLVKDPEERWQTAGDVGRQLNWLAQGGAERGVSLPATRRRIGSGRPALGIFLGIVAGALVAGMAAWNLKPPPPRSVTRFPIVVPAGDQVVAVIGGHNLVAISPNGEYVVYAASNQLYRRAMDEMESTPIRGTEGAARSPFFSANGEWLGFWADAKLKKVPISGGAPVTLCDATSPYRESWGIDDTIVFGQGERGIFRVSAAGGSPEVLIAPTDGERYQGPQMLPDGKSVLFTVLPATATNWDQAQIVAQSLETGERRILVEGGTDARYLRTGHLVYTLNETLLAVPFDAARLEVRGGPVPVVEGVMTGGGKGIGQFGISETGSLVYIPRGIVQAQSRLVWFDRQGRELGDLGEPGYFSNPELSPDGKHLAVRGIDPESGNADIWLIDLDRGVRSRFTFDPADDLYAVWSPDGGRIIFNSTRNGGVYQLYQKPSTGSGKEELLLGADAHIGPFDWSSDGRFLAYLNTAPARDIWLLPLTDGGEPTAFLETPFIEDQAKLSPDGRWIAYTSNESGRDEVFVRSFPEPAGKWQISTQGGVEPRWSPDGKELFYISPDSQLMAVLVSGERELAVGSPIPLFETGTSAARWVPGRRAQYDVASDGQRFLVVRPVNGAKQTEINVVLNWHEELERLVPVN